MEPHDSDLDTLFSDQDNDEAKLNEYFFNLSKSRIQGDIDDDISELIREFEADFEPNNVLVNRKQTDHKSPDTQTQTPTEEHQQPHTPTETQHGAPKIVVYTKILLVIVLYFCMTFGVVYLGMNYKKGTSKLQIASDGDSINRNFQILEESIGEINAILSRNEEQLSELKSEMSDNFKVVDSQIQQLEHLQKTQEAKLAKLLNSTDVPQYLPVFKDKYDGKLHIIPEFEKYLIDLVNSETNLSLSRLNIESYLRNDSVTFINLRNALRENLEGDLVTKLMDEMKTENEKAVNENSSDDKLIIDTVFSKLLKKITNEYNLQKAKKYNYADYENGARIVPEFVSSFDSFNVTELYLKTHRRWKSILGKITKKKVDSALVVNTYHAILSNKLIPRDNYVNAKHLETGIKTFAIKFEKSIYLTDLIISYPRFEQLASVIYSAPKKISVWVQLKNPQRDRQKLKEYLRKRTENNFKDLYDINWEKLEKNLEDGHKDIPVKRIKTQEQIHYEKFYEENFQLFQKNFVKIASMEYDINSNFVNQNFEEINNKDFQNLLVSIESIFFSIESNYGDKFSTNLFKVKAYGMSDFDMYCMKQLLYGKDAATNSFNTSSYNEEVSKFNEKYILDASLEETHEPLEVPQEINLMDQLDYF